VPADDEHVWVWAMTEPRTRLGSNATGAATPLRTLPNSGAVVGTQTTGAVVGSFGTSYLPNTSDWLGRHRLRQNKDNDYEIDREAQRTQTFTGLSSVNLEDQAITESMGGISDRTREHLGTSDAMVVRTRRRLIDAARAFRQDGATPPGVDTPAVYRMRSGGVLLPKDVDWITATYELQHAGAARE
jgi:phthalate 4,5-dioxygenase oxygenase subunit